LERRCISAGLFSVIDRRYKMSHLTELDSFTLPFLQICQSYGLRCLRVLRATKNSNADSPKRPTQNDFGTAFVPTGQPEISQTQGVWVLAHGHQPSKTKSVL
jgi:hypothetical protein